jgi:hypothetical protein
MRGRSVALTFLLALVVSATAEAAALRYQGRVVSVQGGALRLTSTLRPAGPDRWAGTLRCHSLSPYGRCLARVGSLAITFQPDGEFTATVQLGAPCTATGVGTPGTALSGNYTCTIGGETVDAGAFFLRRRGARA